MRGEMRGRYRFLSAYVLFSLLGMDVTLFFVRHAAANAYALTYWLLETVSLFLRFLVIWEIYRHTFRRHGEANRASSMGWGGLGLAAVLVAVSGFTWMRAYRGFHSLLLALVCTAGIVQAVLVLAALSAAKVRGLAIGRNIWGLAIGFGAYVSIDVLNFALVDLNGLLLRFIRTIAPVSYIGMLVVWTWALWNYAPGPERKPGAEWEREKVMGEWAQRWERTRGEVRKVVSP